MKDKDYIQIISDFWDLGEYFKNYDLYGCRVHLHENNGKDDNDEYYKIESLETLVACYNGTGVYRLLRWYQREDLKFPMIIYGDGTFHLIKSALHLDTFMLQCHISKYRLATKEEMKLLTENTIED